MLDNEQSGTSQSALPTTDLRQVVQETVANTVAQLSNSLASSIDQRLEELKRSFVPAQSEACASKKLKLETQTIKKPGNAHQYGHEVKVLDLKKRLTNWVATRLKRRVLLFKKASPLSNTG